MTPADKIQLPPCCLCGSPDLCRGGLCKFCYNRGRRSRACYAWLHRLRAIDRWGPDRLETLWAEQRP